MLKMYQSQISHLNSSPSHGVEFTPINVFLIAIKAKTWNLLLEHVL